MVTPSPAVTVVKMVVVSAFNETGADAAPDVAATLFTVSVDVGSWVVAVTLIELVAVGTVV